MTFRMMAFILIKYINSGFAEKKSAKYGSLKYNLILKKMSVEVGRLIIITIEILTDPPSSPHEKPPASLLQ